MILPDVVQGSAAWHELRAGGVGGSESAAFFGLEKRTFGLSLWGLYQVKGGFMDMAELVTPEAEAGREMEPGILATIAKREGLDVRTGGYVISDEDPRLRFSPDGIAAQPPAHMLTRWPDLAGQPGIVEIKMVRAEALQDEWGWNPKEPERPTPPRRHSIQVNHGMLTTGFQWGVLGVMIKGSWFPAYYARRDEAVCDGIRAGVDDLYRRILFCDEPPIDGHDTTQRIVKQHYRRSRFKHLDLRGKPEADAIASEHEVATQNRRDWNQRYTAADNAARHLLGDYETAETDSFRISIKPDKNENRHIVRVRMKSEIP